VPDIPIVGPILDEVGAAAPTSGSQGVIDLVTGLLGGDR
jgi:hypothetical protein